MSLFRVDCSHFRDMDLDFSSDESSLSVSDEEIAGADDLDQNLFGDVK